MKITDVRPFTSTASLEVGTGTSDAVFDNSRAIERIHATGPEAFPVYIATAADGAIIAERPEIRSMADSSRLRDIKNELVDKWQNGKGHFKLVDNGSAARLWLGQVDERIDRFLPTGQPVSTPVALDDGELIGKVFDEFEHWAKWYNIRDISNQSSDRIKASISLEPDPSGHDFKHGDICRFTVKNTGDEEMYFVVLIISTDGSVSVLYPSQRNAIRPSELLSNELGRNTKSRRIRLNVPGGYDTVTDVIKVIAADRQFPVRFLEQKRREREKELTRSVPRSPNAFVAMLETAAAQTNTRDASLVEVDDWYTDSVSYTVKKPAANGVGQ